MTKPDLRLVFERYDVEVPDNGRREVSVRCPVHDEDHASCSVNLEDGLFTCHACGAAGDSYSLLMLKENCDFATAQRIGAEVFGAGGSDLREPARFKRVGISGESRAGGGYKPRYRNQPPTRRRSLTDKG